MSKAAAAQSPTEVKEQLAKYRAKSAAIAHKAVGDPEEVAKDGLQVFTALSPARERANASALSKE